MKEQKTYSPSGEKEPFRIIKVTAVNSRRSLETIEAGTEVKVPCNIFAPLTTVQSAARRLNLKSGLVEFTVSSPDNGATLVIRRYRREEAEPLEEVKAGKEQ